MICRVLYVLILVAVVSTASADTVLLTSGRAFENVVAEVRQDGVLVRFSYGEMVLPPGLVAKVEKSESSLERYLRGAAALAEDRQASAAEWLELALETRAEGLEDGYRRALLRAADLDPHWPRLRAELHALDYVFDPPRGRWLPYSESTAGQEARLARESARQAAAAEAATRAQAAEQDRLTRALEMALVAQIAAQLEERRPPEPEPTTGVPLWGPSVPYAVIATPAWVAHPHGGSGRSHGWPDTPANRATLHELSRRQPGSLLPLTPPRHSRGSFRAPERD